MKVDNSNIARKSLFLFSYNIFGSVIGYVTMFFALRFVGQDAWGIYGAALGIAGLLGILSSLGVDATHVKKVTQKEEKEECMGAYILIKGFLGLIYLISSFGAFFIMGDILGFKFESPYLREAVYISVFGMFISSIANIFRTHYQARLEAKKSVLPMFSQATVQNVIIIIVSLYFTLNPGLNREFMGVLFSYAYLLGTFSRLVIYLLMGFGDEFAVRKPTKSLVKEYILFSVPLALLGIVAVIQAYTDRTMLQFFWNSREVGGYFTVQKLSLALIYVGSSVGFFLYPAQSSHYEKGNKKIFFQITSKSERYLSMVTVPFVFFTIVMAPEILNIFKHSLVSYSTPLMILVIYAYLNVINRPYGSQMTSANKPHEVMKVGIIQAVVNVFLNTIFIPSSILGMPMLGWKSTGAALATLLSFIIGFIYLRYKAWKILGTKYEKRLVYHLLSGSVAMFSLYFIKCFTGPLYLWYLIAGAFVIFGGIYTLILYLCGEIGYNELRLVRKIIENF